MLTLPRFTAIVVCLLVARVAAAPGSSPLSTNELRVGERVTLAGALKTDAVDTLRHEDAVVVDLRHADEGTSTERNRLADAGVTYYHLPMGGAAPEPATVATLAALLNDHPEQPLVIHCASGNRAGLLWASYLIDTGTSVEDALQAVAPIAVRASIRESIREYAIANDQR